MVRILTSIRLMMARQIWASLSLTISGKGIHGSEIQILGQTLSANEAGLPLLGAMGGMAVGALLPNIRQLRLAKQRSTWNPSGQKQGLIKRIMGNIPEVRAKRYDRKEDTNIKNPLFKNKTYDKVHSSC